MSLVVHLSEELSRRVEAVAAERNQSPEQVAVEAIEAQLPNRRRLNFVGMGHSGHPAGAERLKELRRELATKKLADLDRSAEG
jgi:hypothetical protein